MSGEIAKPIIIKKRSTPKLESLKGAPARAPLSVQEKEVVIEDVRGRIESLVKLMVDDPSDISISISQGERTTIFVISCGRLSLGKIIGSKGKTVESLRTVIQAITAKFGFRSIIQIPYYPKEADHSR